MNVYVVLANDPKNGITLDAFYSLENAKYGASCIAKRRNDSAVPIYKSDNDDNPLHQFSYNDGDGYADVYELEIL